MMVICRVKRTRTEQGRKKECKNGSRNEISQLLSHSMYELNSTLLLLLLLLLYSGGVT